MTAVDRPDNGHDEGPWRVGSHYGIHVYKGGDPVATFLRPENAAEAVAAVNAQIAARAGAGEQQDDDEPPADPPTVLQEAIDELDRLGDEHHEDADPLNAVIDGFRRWATARADELTVRRPCPYGCAGGHTDYEYDDQHRNPEGGPW